MINLIGGIEFCKLYFAAITFSILFGAFKPMSRAKKGVYLFIFFSFLAFLTGFRAPSIGNDTATYLEHFKNIASYNTPFRYINRNGMEPGYVIYCWLLSRISREPQILLIVTSAIVYISTGSFVYKYTERPGLFCCLFIGIMQFDFFMSIMRQALALAIILFSFNYIVKQKPIRFLIVCLLAVTFHYSSILFILTYPLVRNKRRENKNSFSYFLPLIATLIASMFFSNVINGVLTIFPKYTYYLGSKSFDGVPRLALILKIVVYALLFFVPKLLSHHKSANEQNEEIYDRLSYINICILVLAMNAVILDRFGSTFSMFATLHYSNQVAAMEKADKVIITCLTLIAFAFYGFIIILYRTPEWVTTYPIELIF